LRDEDIKKVIQALQTKVPSYIADCLFNIPPLKLQCKAKFLQELNEHCTSLTKRKQPSVLLQKDYPDMVAFDWNVLIKEMSSRCPLLLDIFLTVVQKNKTTLDSVLLPMGLCYAILMQQRNHELSLVQRINTILLTEGKAKSQVKCPV